MIPVSLIKRVVLEDPTQRISEETAITLFHRVRSLGHLAMVKIFKLSPLRDASVVKTKRETSWVRLRLFQKGTDFVIDISQ